MSNWKEMLNSYGRVGFIATATSGLWPSQDTLLGVAYDIEGEGGKHGKLLKTVSADELAKAKEYHRITPEMMIAEAYPDSSFREKLHSLLSEQGVIWLTYNVDFHSKFITNELGYCPKLLDLPRLLRLAESRIMLRSTETISDVEKAAKDLPIVPRTTFSDICSSHGIEADVQPGTIPCEVSCHNLRQLFDKFEQLEVVVLQEDYN